MSKNNTIKREKEIREIAHRIWIETGCPDGDILVSRCGKMVPLKEVHWEVAVIEWTYGPEYLI